MKSVSTIKKFAFASEDAFTKFREGIRTGPAIKEKGQLLALTVDAEKAFRRANWIRRLFYEKEIRPAHFFIAASELGLSTVDPTEYYKQIGQLDFAANRRNPIAGLVLRIRRK